MSVIEFRDARNGAAVAALDRAVVHASSAGLDWRGITTEIGSNPPWETNDLASPSHYLAMNTGTETLRFERWAGHRMESVAIAPGQFWLQPAGEPFSHRVRDVADYGAVTLDVDRVFATVRAPLTFAPTYGVDDPILGHLARALFEETFAGNPGGALLADGIATAVIAHLARTYGTAPGEEHRGGLTGAVRRRVLEYIDAHLAEPITLTELAGIAGLTLHHFAREFKNAIGAPPHEYVMARRVDRAKEMLRFGGMPLAEVALANGFSDQAHFTRVFRKRTGITPGAYARQRR